MISRVFISLIIFAAMVEPLMPQRKPATGPLRILPSNLRWFTDGTGRAVYLAGSHIWQSLQDNGLYVEEHFINGEKASPLQSPPT